MSISKVARIFSLFRRLAGRKSLQLVSSLNSVQLWNISSEVIIGGCGLLSKRPTRYSSRSWPAYMRECKGIYVKSWDKKVYRDFTEFSIGCALLGYRPSSHKLVKNLLQVQSPLCTLLSPYEPILALELNNFLNEQRAWKFCRGGGEALAIAARLARTVATSSCVLVCGYHGTHDWYLASNLSKNNDLSKIFIDGISADGIPSEYAGSTVCLSEFSADNLRSSILSNKPGVIFFEACRYELLDQELVDILKSFQDAGGILVADEVTSGFRFKRKLAVYECGLSPDFVVLGKSLGNGYAISAIGAKNHYKQALESCFLSSTHWTEAIGLQAGVCSLQAWNDWDSFYDEVARNGERIRQAIISALTFSKLSFTINNIPTMISFKIDSLHGFSSTELRTLLIHRMLSKGFLLSTTIYPSIEHTNFHTFLFKKALTDCCSNLFIDVIHNQNLLRSELAKIGTVEIGFSRTQKL